MILLSPNLMMRPPNIVEANLFVSWLNDPDVVRYSEQRHKTHTTLSQVDYWRSAATAEPNLVYAICMKDTDSPIGSISASIDTNNNIANVGIMIGDKTKWSKGYGFEAWECFCNYLVVEKKIRKIEAGCMALNIQMAKICIKYGMIQEGTIHQHFLIKTGVPIAMLLYGKIMR